METGARYSISSNFRGPKIRENVENHKNVNFCGKNFVIELVEITACPHVL